MQRSIRMFAGRCTVTENDATREGEVVAVVKPDNTVLVHDAEGYQPAAWLTRADAVQVERDDGGFRLRARKGDDRLAVRGSTIGQAEFAVSPSGPRVGTCPHCEAPLVRDRGSVACIGCGREYPLPRDATLTDDTCEDCGLPTISVERGDHFEVCLDRECESIDQAVRDRFAGAWTCPDCASTLAIERERGLRATCPDCDRSHRLPGGIVSDPCACGLPTFETVDGPRCLDPDCEASGAH
ncbi:MAG: DUF91 domain-containing protein [Halanaeroarchaeum sp.]